MPLGARVTAILALIGIALAGGVVSRHDALQAELDDLTSTRVELASLVDAESGESRDLNTDLLDLDLQRVVLDAVVDARDAFGESVADFQKSVADAEGKVDVAAEREKVVAAQDVAIAERNDPSVVDAATATVDEGTKTVRAAIAAFDEEQRRQAAAASSGGARTVPVSSAGGYDRVRAALDTVGGGGVELREFDGGCGGGVSPACASSAGFIMYAPSLLSWSQDRLLWAMAHELSHIHQFRVWGALNASPGYGSLFGGNIELLANCMAAARGFPSVNVSCSGDQVSWAASIWGGVVPG